MHVRRRRKKKNHWRGRHVGQSALERIARARRPEPADPRCLGRPLLPRNTP